MVNDGYIDHPGGRFPGLMIVNDGFLDGFLDGVNPGSMNHGLSIKGLLPK